MTLPVVAVAGAAVAVLTACGASGGGVAAAGEAPRPAGPLAAPPPPDPARLYRGMGLIAHGEPFPITGRLSYLAGASAETTFVVVTIALPNRALTFTHDGDRYRAGYAVDVLVRQRGDSAARLSAREAVVVASFRETARTDESVLFQQLLRLAPGRYEMQLRLRDEGSDRMVADTTALDVPRLGAGTLGTPVPYYEAVMRERPADVPRLLAMPRATVTFGRDSTLPVYVEAYGPADGDAGSAGSAGSATIGVAVRAVARGEDGAVVWRDSVVVAWRGGGLASAVLSLPVARLGIGAVTLDLWRADGGDTVRAPLFVTLGAELPAATFEDMLSYLRFFAAPARLERLRSTPPAQRGAAWIAFLAGTGSDPAGAGGSARELQQYFARLQVADQRYAEEEGPPGWLTDRGMVFAAFGDPDQIVEPGPTAIEPRSRMQRWVYRERGLQFEFHDVTGFERWRLSPASESAFRAALARLRALPTR
ncbi:MAG: GWxTD domain-containing protein [Gemmatimonadaceae bacterium]